MNTLIMTLRTVRYLKAEQIVFRCLRKIHKPKLKNLTAPSTASFSRITDTIGKTEFLKDSKFRFHNLEGGFNGWNDLSHGQLWVYSLNCMDFLEQQGADAGQCADWIDTFIHDQASNSIGFAPYPVAIRCMNWLKFFSAHPEYATSNRLDSLYSQLVMLSKMTERQILGNHILEDAITLYVGASAFKDRCLGLKAQRLLKRELERQILPDGAHFEQSPTYHCVMTEKVLDCINLTAGNGFLNLDQLLSDKAQRMVGHLKSIIWDDQTTPLFGDSNYGSESLPSAILDYATRLGMDSAPSPMKECGYRKFRSERIEVIIDAGNITASYQPGHSHADTFSYEMRIDGKPFIVDTGISTYDKTARRQYERGTSAHNTVVYAGLDSSQVWGGFRMGSRASVSIIKESDNYIEASHDGYGNSHIHTRSFKLNINELTINDRLTGQKEKVSFIHFSPDTVVLAADNSEIRTDKAVIRLTGATNVAIIETQVSQEFNNLQPSKTAMIAFGDTLVQIIAPN